MNEHVCKSCGGVRTDLRRRILGNGALQIVYQCLTCGRSATNPLKQSSIRHPERIPLWDDTIAARYDAARSADRDREKEDWFREHNAYLQTQAWREKRALVIKRCKGICEGCGVAQVTQVHHLTYEHWRDELLWELVGVCDDCHERAHKKPEAL